VCTDTPWCCSRALRAYLALRKRYGLSMEPDDPLFLMANGNPLTRNVLTYAWKEFLKRAKIPYVGRGISFRSGGMVQVAQKVGTWIGKCLTNHFCFFDTFTNLTFWDTFSARFDRRPSEPPPIGGTVALIKPFWSNIWRSSGSAARPMPRGKAN
jgi:hypothetical protein